MGITGLPTRPGLVAFYISGGRREHSRRTLTDAEVSYRFQLRDVAHQLRTKGPEGLSEAAKEFLRKHDLPWNGEIMTEAILEDAMGGEGTLSRKSLLYRATHQHVPPPKPPQGPITDGLTVGNIAERIGLDKETTTRLLENAGWLESVTYAGHPRRLVPCYVIEQGDGDNITSPGRGQKGPRVFPVFNPESVDAILWTLEWDKITKGVEEQPSKKAKLTWLMDRYGFLPDKTMAELSGMNVRTVERRRATR